MRASMLSARLRSSYGYVRSVRSLKTIAQTTVGIPKESWVGERRIAQTPDTVKELTKKGFQVSFRAPRHSCELTE